MWSFILQKSTHKIPLELSLKVDPICRNLKTSDIYLFSEEGLQVKQGFLNNQKAEARTSPFLLRDRLACPSWFSATQPSITVKFELWNLICLGSDPGIAVYWLCNLTNNPSLSFLIYKMEVIINLHGLLGGLKDNEHGALYINTPQVLVSSILPLSSFAAVWPRLTSRPVPSSTRSRLLYWACVWRCTCCCRIWRRVTQCSLWVDLSQKDRSLGSANVILHLVDQHATSSWLGSSFHTPQT